MPPPEAFGQTVSYVRICGGGMVVIVAYNLIGCIFRGLGDSRTPLITVAIVSGMGVIASAGVGVAEKVCAFIMLISSAFMQSMSAFVAQNYGAGKLDRAKKALYYGIGVSFVMGVAMFAVTFFHGDVLAGIFSPDREIILAAADYLEAYAIDCLFTAVFFCYVGFYNGIGKTRFVMLQGILGAFGVRVPVSYLMSRLPGATLFRIGLATPMSSVLQRILCLGYFAVVMKKEKREG